MDDQDDFADFVLGEPIKAPTKAPIPILSKSPRTKTLVPREGKKERVIKKKMTRTLRQLSKNLWSEPSEDEQEIQEKSFTGRRANRINTKLKNKNKKKKLKYNAPRDWNDLIAQNDCFKLNNSMPFPEVMDFENNSLVFQLHQARFLPDKINFVKARSLLITENGIVGEHQETIGRLTGDLNEMFFSHSMAFDNLNRSSYNDYYLLIFLYTFQDFFEEEDVEFEPLLFGFSLMKLFQPTGALSLTDTVEFIY